MSASICDIAREVGVSHSVVSRLFRGDATLRISDARRAEIFDARERLGGVKVRPSKLTHTVIAPQGQDVATEYLKRNLRSEPTIRTFEREMEARGYRVRYEYLPEAIICDELRKWMIRPKHPDGLLILSNYCTPELAKLLATYAFPHVSNDFTREYLSINTISYHATGGMRQLVEHLVALGHRKIAFWGPRQMYRYPMMVSAMVNLDLPFDPAVHCWLPEMEYPANKDDIRRHAAEAFDAWHARHGDVTAIVGSNDYCALGVVDAMRRRGLVPGRDLSVVGFDNIEPREPMLKTHPILTTIDNPFERIGRRMAESLLNQVEEGKSQIVHERLPVKLVVRETTGPARTHF